MADDRHTILVLGGARSGKSAFAQGLTQRLGGPVLFVATAIVGDREMAARVEAHRAARPTAWVTLEAPLTVGDAIRTSGHAPRTILLDCLTLLTSNVMMALAQPASVSPEDPVTGESPGFSIPVDEARCGERMAHEIDSLVATAHDLRANLVVVSGETGLGVVPPFPLGRLYRDVLGSANQTLARAADRVFFMVAGIGIDLRRFGVEDPAMLDLGQNAP
jgi:adenosylcobinamide kinase/adenosylcobinamide-phosphate guanylyltransferase